MTIFKRICSLLAAILFVLTSSSPVLAQFTENDEKRLLLVAPFYENASNFLGSNQCTGLGLPNITDSQVVADSINKYIEDFEKRSGRSSPYHGLGESFVTGGQSGGVNPFLAVAQLEHESGFATAADGWHKTNPPSYNGFGRSALPHHPHSTYTRPSGEVRLVYRWNSWQDSLDGPENWFKYIRAVYLETYQINQDDLPAFIAKYAPKSDGNNEEAYVNAIRKTIQALADGAAQGLSCGADISQGEGGNPESNIQLGQRLAAEAGWTGNEWTCLLSLWMSESRWSELADNDSSTAFGIPQAMLSIHHEDINANFPGFYEGPLQKPTGGKAEPQIRWGIKYIKGRYGTACEAWGFKQRNGHY